MIIKEIGDLDRQKWNDFVLKNKGEFLQSWEWGDFKQLVGSPSTALGARNIWRLGVVGDNKEILAVALAIRHALPLGKNYLYCPRGPIFKNPKPKTQNPKVVDLLLDKVKEIAQSENSVFLRIEPCEEKESNLETEFPSILGNSVSRYPAPNLQPQNTLILDITKPEKQLLAEMKPKTRYNIKLAKKRGVKIRMSDKNTFETDFEKFWQLAQETSRRDGFKIHPKEYYRKILKVLPFAKLFFAEYEGKTLSANIVIFFGPRAIYLHGASSDKNRNLMAPYLLQWEQIKKAQKLGCKEYDFWGVASQSQPTTYNLQPKNWQGITRFKTGFGGKELNYPEAIDFVFQKGFYRLIKFAKGLKKFFRPIQVF